MRRDDVRAAATGVHFSDRCTRARLGGARGALRRRQSAARVRRHAADAIAFALATEIFATPQPPRLVSVPPLCGDGLAAMYAEQDHEVDCRQRESDDPPHERRLEA